MPRARLTEGKVGITLFRLTVPMVFGTFSIVVFNLADTYFVGRLGTGPLAALSFTFPVVLVVGSLAMGLGIGASALISRAVGEGNHHRVERLTTDSLLLALFVVAVFAAVGYFTVDPLFRALGAGRELIPLIREYMKIWYLGMIFIVVPMVGNNAIRAVGDSLTPGVIMTVAAAVNVIADPIFIFGMGPFPRMGISGAAVATVIARATTFAVALIVLLFREKMITFKPVSASALSRSWSRILYLGLPMAGARIVMPIGLGVITRMVASFGHEAVAAFGVSWRIEFFAMAVIMALSSILSPFVGQNWGAAMFERVKLAVKYSDRFSLLWGFAMAVVLAFLGGPIASLFSQDPHVIAATRTYMSIVPVGYGLGGVLVLSAAAMNVLHRPIQASALMISQMFLLAIPLAFILSRYMGLSGIFLSLMLSYVISGAASYYVLKSICL